MNADCSSVATGVGRDVTGRNPNEERGIKGSGLVRSLLVEVAWAGLRHNAWMRQTYHRLSAGGKKARKKIAIVAVGRKLLVRCWAMLRDNCAWDWRPQIT